MAIETVTPSAGDIANAQARGKAGLRLVSGGEVPHGVEQAHGLSNADPSAAMAAGAELFDRTAKTIGEVSARSFGLGGVEDHHAMVGVLLAALRDAVTRGPDVAFGFALPLVDLIDCHRLGCSPSDEWSGVAVLREVSEARGVKQTAPDVHNDQLEAQ